MARRLLWSDVRGGAIAVCAIAVAAVAMLKFSSVGALHGDTFPLYARVGEARGLLVGSEVWLSGQKIGKVAAIRFRSPARSDTSARIEIEMRVLEKYRSAIHEDAIAQIQNGGTIIGASVMYLTSGTSGAPPLRPGDSVTTHPQAEIESRSAQFRAVTHEFPMIMNNVTMLVTQLQATQGTIGAFLNAPGGPGSGELTRARAAASQLGARLSSTGTVGKFMQGGLTLRVDRVMARADSVRVLLASSRTSYGRFRRDSSLRAEVADIHNELSIVRVLEDEPRGTAGRALHDSAVTNALGETEREMSRLLADMKKHPLRYVSF
jgi:phospholipid/cholesterol/gamma-HCH transport system substrate-binding protein